MNNTPHRVHGISHVDALADWPPINDQQIHELFARFPQLEGDWEITWLSPRPLSAAALVDTVHGRVFVKRHYHSVRNAPCLTEEHDFIAHLAASKLPVAEVFRDDNGNTAIAQGQWTFEIHSVGDGEDVYRDTPSWIPMTSAQQASAIGSMLARLHCAALTYQAPQRSTHILVTRDDLIRAEDPLTSLQQQLHERPGLNGYLQSRNWQTDFEQVLLPWHVDLAQRLQCEPPLWAHNDLHASNLLWQCQGDARQIGTILDFGLASPTSAAFDLATTIERNAIAWLTLEQGPDAVHIDIALALIEGYRQVRPMTAAQIHLMADLLPLVHLDFALSEVEYFHSITGNQTNANVAYDTFLLGHAQWFNSAPGQALLEALHKAA